MRKLVWIAMVVALGALPLGAAEQQGPPPRGGQPGGGPGGQRRGPGGAMRGGPGGRVFGPGGGMLNPGDRTEIFDAARRTLDLSAEAKAGVDQLDAQYADQLEAAIAELRAKMNKEYVAKVLGLLPDDQKPKYEAVAKALSERDEAVAAAQKELNGVLDKVKTSQGADKAPRTAARPRLGMMMGGASNSKVEVLRTDFVLTEQQQEQLNTAQREGFGGMRERMQGLFGGMRNAGGPPDPNAFRQIGQAVRQVRDEVDDEVAKAAVAFLSDAQKQDYATACAAIDTSRKKTKEAEEACRKKIVEAVGEEKANALLGAPPGQPVQPKQGTTF